VAYCYWHDDSMKAYRSMSCSKGGKAPRRASELSELVGRDFSKDGDLLQLERRLFSETLLGRMKPGTMRSLLT
jgi:hypothetical protein